ncbi:RNA polymerase sigma-70 factor [Desertivirga arenae]|uniref:RNA polymerase sigma-70 factor n=1 Tax=Desertivirga arenae TaxID=2810309 RepID=UPI001A9768DE|nr:RNA polymerase sigma-70 factor [Pedobacter sp. SYSU D00823]
MGNLAKFEEIYSQHWEKLYAFCFKLTRDEHLSENIVQEVFTDLWERRHKLQISSIESFLFRAVKNQIFKEYRNNTFEVALIEEQFEDYVQESSCALETELMDQLYLLLEELPPKRKAILMMNKLEDMDLEQIAERLNLSKQTVKNQLSSAVQQLKLKAGKLSVCLIPLLVALLHFIIS